MKARIETNQGMGIEEQSRWAGLEGQQVIQRSNQNGVVLYERPRYAVC